MEGVEIGKQVGKRPWGGGGHKNANGDLKKNITQKDGPQNTNTCKKYCEKNASNNFALILNANAETIENKTKKNYSKAKLTLVY